MWLYKAFVLVRYSYWLLISRSDFYLPFKIILKGVLFATDVTIMFKHLILYLTSVENWLP